MRLPLQEVLSDFDAITGIGSRWREQDITLREIRSFCIWRQAPMLLPGPPAGQVRACGQGAAGCGFHELERPRLLLQIRPHRREVRADRRPGPGQIPAKYRGERNPGETPEFKDWREWEVASGHFYAEDLEQVRRELLAEGHCPKVVMRSMSEWRCLRLRVCAPSACPSRTSNVALSRQSEGLSDAQAARNLKASVLAQLGNPEPNDIILELSDETYDATREWTFSQQAMQVVDDQVVVDTVLDQPLGALSNVSYQLFCGDEILESAFEQQPDKPVIVTNERFWLDRFLQLDLVRPGAKVNPHVSGEDKALWLVAS